MKKSIAIVAGAVVSLMMAHGVLAESAFQQHYEKCVDQFASGGEAASVMLECNAAGGKLDACKVKENSSPGKGFDKAAICIAAFLPIGSKTGSVQVPIKFVGA
jgi:hypothetical protein